MPLCYHNQALYFSSPALVPRWGNPNITLIMNKCGQVLVAQRLRSSRDGDPVPPFPGVAAPGAWLGSPSPRPGKDMPYTPFFLRGYASFSRSKPDAGSLVPRSPLWVSSALSFLVSASPFLMLPRFARCFHRGYLATLATAMRFFFLPNWANAQTAKSLHATKDFNHFADLTKMVINVDTLR